MIKFLNQFFRFFVGAKNFHPEPEPKSFQEKGYIAKNPILCKFKKGFYRFFGVGRRKIPTISVPCLIIILAVIFPMQVRAEIEIGNATIFNDVIVYDTKSTTLNIDKGLIECFSKFGNGLNEFLSFI